MTNQELINYYSNLLILQYIGRAKAYATIQALVTPVIMGQLPTQVRDAFDIPTAVGVQLDVIGKYVGVTRSGFIFDGIAITLDDADFRGLLTLKIFTNNAGSSLYTIQKLISMYFAGQIFVFDYFGMRMSYFLDTSIGSQSLAEMIIVQGLLPKPSGVQLGSTIYASDEINEFFGCKTYDAVAVNSSPLNTYDVYSMDFPFLNYDYALVP